MHTTLEDNQTTNSREAASQLGATYDELCQFAVTLCHADAAALFFFNEKQRVGNTNSPGCNEAARDFLKQQTEYFTISAHEINPEHGDLLTYNSTDFHSAAGAPLLSQGSTNLGTLLVFYAENRDNSTPSSTQLSTLTMLARQAVSHCEQQRRLNEYQAIEDDLRESNAILEATQEAAADGIFLVDDSGVLVRYNKRFLELWRIPAEQMEELQLNRQLMFFVMESLHEPDDFINCISYLYEHPHASARDEVELKDGRIFYRYSAPALSREGHSYGRVWSFTDISELKERERIICQQQEQLREANAQLEELATRDGLTGILNRRAFEARLADEIRRADRYRLPLSLIILDVDKFKSYNDEFGHPAGDEVLKMVAHLLDTETRATDIAARYGGEEFVIILPDTEHEGSLILTNRMRSYIEHGAWTERAITASFGVSSLSPEISTAQALLESADKALYAAKEAGRNRVFHYLDL